MDYALNFEKTQKILHAYVDEMYFLEKGVFVPDFEKIISFADGRFSRRQIKHIIEQRKAEGKSINNLKHLMDCALEALREPDFVLLNTNQSHPGSIMRVKFFEMEKTGVVVVMDAEIKKCRDVITAFSRDIKGIKRLHKKLQESASGETPRS
jgi:hypothetical protein